MCMEERERGSDAFGSPEGEKPETAKKKVADIDFTTEDGRVMWREKYEDGSVQPVWNYTNIESNDRQGWDKLRTQLMQERGLTEREGGQ